jgi:transposase
MDGSICLTLQERKVLLRVCRSGDTRLSRRANVLLLLHDGWSYRQVRAALYVSNDLIADSVTRYRRGGLDQVLEDRAASGIAPGWVALVTKWLQRKTPQDFGYFRQRWTCGMLAEVLAWETGIRLSEETVRRAVRRAGFVWRRPRPIVGPTDPLYDEKLGRIRRLLARLPGDETAVFQDEVDVHLNPKIGSCWMLRGQQAEVVTPGNNEKRYVAGSLHWRTGTLLASPPGRQRNAQLFLAHLDDLRHRLRCYRRIHVICDNARFHDCWAVREYLEKWGDRIVLHFLPKYAPETNPIERVWWHLHETITRNHRFQTMDQLLDEVYEWIETEQAFMVETSLYALAA